MFISEWDGSMNILNKSCIIEADIIGMRGSRTSCAAGPMEEVGNANHVAIKFRRAVTMKIAVEDREATLR